MRVQTTFFYAAEVESHSDDGKKLWPRSLMSSFVSASQFCTRKQIVSVEDTWEN